MCSNQVRSRCQTSNFRIKVMRVAVTLAACLSPLLSFAQVCYVPSAEEIVMSGDTILRFDKQPPVKYSCIDLSEVQASTFRGFYSASYSEEELYASCVILPKTLKYILSPVFCDRGLEDVALPDGLRRIGRSAFYGNRLKTIHLPDSCLEVSEHAFECNEISSFTWPKVELRRFGGFCSNKIDTLHIPSNVKSLQAYAFAKNPLRSILFAEGIDSIGSYAFAGDGPYLLEDADTDAMYKELVLPNSLSFIGNNAFRRALRLKSVSFGSGIKNIGEEAFYRCDSLTELSFPQSLSRIGESAFALCSRLRAIVLNDGLRYVGSCAFNCCNLEGVIVIPGTLKTVGSSSFANSLAPEKDIEIVFKNGVDTIGDYAFSQALVSADQPIVRARLSFPPTLRRIGKGAFMGVWYPETPLPAEDESGRKLRWDAFLDGVLVESDIRTVGGLNRVGYTKFSEYSYEATAVGPEASISEPEAWRGEVTVYDHSGRVVYSGAESSARLPKGVYVVRHADGSSSLRKF